MQPQDTIDLLADTGRRLDAFARLDPAVHRRTFAPGKWTAAEILAHLSDIDTAFYYRFLKAAAEAGSAVVPFDHELWAKELQVANRPVEVSMAVIRGVHAALGHHLATLPAATLANIGHHPEKGPMSALHMGSIAARHTLHHVIQLEAIRDGRAWTAAEKIDYWAAPAMA